MVCWFVMQCNRYRTLRALGVIALQCLKAGESSDKDCPGRFLCFDRTYLKHPKILKDQVSVNTTRPFQYCRSAQRLAEMVPYTHLPFSLSPLVQRARLP